MEKIKNFEAFKNETIEVNEELNNSRGGTGTTYTSTGDGCDVTVCHSDGNCFTYEPLIKAPKSTHDSFLKN